MASQAKFLDFIDMIDGGGAGRMGDTFQGGGIFSALANLMATPYGSEDEGRRARREAFLRSRGLLDEPDVASVAEPSARVAIPRVRPAPETLQYSGRGNVGMPTPPMQYSGRGNVGMPAANPFTGPTYDMPAAPMQYSGRGNVGMPIPDPSQYSGQISQSEIERYGRVVPPVPASSRQYTETEAARSMQPMQYSGRGTASGDAEFDAFMNMVRAMPGQGALANDPELAFSIFQRMKAAGNLPSVMMYQ